MKKKMFSMSSLRAYTILLVSCLFLVNVMATLFDETSKSKGRVCKTKACIEAASKILDNVDTTVKPCDNFYQFACGKIVKDAVIPEDKSSASMFGRTNKKLQQQLKASLEREMENDAPRTLKLLQSYYNLCLDTEQIEKTSTYDVLNILNELGGWPVINDDWNPSNFDWRKLIYQMRKLGYTRSMDAFIEFNIEVDDQISDRYVLTLDQASTGIKKEYLQKGLTEKVVQAYYKYMIDIAEVLGASRQRAEQELAESLDFEMELAKISLVQEERRNQSQLYNPMTIEQLESEYPDVPWYEYLNQILSPEDRVAFDDKIIVRVPSYLKSFSKLINNTPKRVLANYAVWRVVQSSTYFMNRRVKNTIAEFGAAVTGTKVQEPRWIQCIDYVSSYLHLATGALYVREYFDKKSKNIAEELVTGIRKSFAGLLDEVDWMDEKTKQAAKIKLDSVQQHIAYPDELLDDKKLDAYYQNLEIEPESFLKSHLNIQLFSLKNVLEKWRKPVDKNHWTTHGHVAIVNAFYQPSENSIQIPAAILQDVFFSSARPNYLNYGAIGWIIGHEFTHGFDDQGSQFNGVGDLINWWDPKTQEEYRDRAQCIIQQYSNYTVKEVDLNLNGKNTQGENIADNGGIKEAYLAYEDYERQNGEEPRLPGLPYTTKQLFWISSANVWCAKYRPEAMRNQIITGVHSINEFRVIGPFSNMLQFSKDFECPLGSPMNPVNKCTVW